MADSQKLKDILIHLEKNPQQRVKYNKRCFMNDSRWESKYLPYTPREPGLKNWFATLKDGFLNKFTGETIGEAGCVVTAITNALKNCDSIFKDLTPDKLCQIAEKNGFGSTSYNLRIEQLLDYLGYTAHGFTLEKMTCSIPEMYSALEQCMEKGALVILQFSSPSGSGLSHCVNVEEVYTKNGEFFLKILETKQNDPNFIDKELNISELTKDKKAKIIIITKDDEKIKGERNEFDKIDSSENKGGGGQSSIRRFDVFKKEMNKIHTVELPKMGMSALGSAVGSFLIDIDKIKSIGDFFRLFKKLLVNLVINLGLQYTICVIDALLQTFDKIPIFGFSVLIFSVIFQITLTVLNKENKSSRDVNKLLVKIFVQLGLTMGCSNLFQAIIPIPLLGAFVGGFLGGLLSGLNNRIGISDWVYDKICSWCKI